MLPGSGNSIATCRHGNYAPCRLCDEIRAEEEYQEEEDNDDDAHVFSREKQGESKDNRA